jgi:hypothetical protein
VHHAHRNSRRLLSRTAQLVLCTSCCREDVSPSSSKNTAYSRPLPLSPDHSQLDRDSSRQRCDGRMHTNKDTDRTPMVAAALPRAAKDSSHAAHTHTNTYTHVCDFEGISREGTHTSCEALSRCLIIKPYTLGSSHWNAGWQGCPPALHTSSRCIIALQPLQLAAPAYLHTPIGRAPRALCAGLTHTCKNLSKLGAWAGPHKNREPHTDTPLSP